MELLITIQTAIIIALLVKNSNLYRETKDLRGEIGKLREINHCISAKLVDATRRHRAMEER